MVDSTFWRRQCMYLPAMAGWFFCSVALTAWGKVEYGKKHNGFPYPLLMTSVVMFIQWIFGIVAGETFPHYFGVVVVKNMTWKTYLGVSVPCGLVTIGEIAFESIALETISVTFYTMVTSSAPVFVLLSAFAFGIEKITVALVASVLLIAAGEVLTAAGETEFEMTGFLLCIGCSVCAGMRWVLAQFILSKLDPPLKGPVAMIRVLSSTMFFSCLLASLIIEQPWSGTLRDYFSSSEILTDTILMVLAAAALAIGCSFCQYWLIVHSNAFVMMIGSVLKVLVGILVGVVWFKDRLDVLNTSGIVVVLLGLVLYKVTNHRSKTVKEKRLSDIESNDEFQKRPLPRCTSGSQDHTRVAMAGEDGPTRKLSPTTVAYIVGIDEEPLLSSFSSVGESTTQW